MPWHRWEELRNLCGTCENSHIWPGHMFKAAIWVQYKDPKTCAFTKLACGFYLKTSGFIRLNLAPKLSSSCGLIHQCLRDKTAKMKRFTCGNILRFQRRVLAALFSYLRKLTNLAEINVGFTYIWLKYRFKIVCKATKTQISFLGVFTVQLVLKFLVSMSWIEKRR